MVMKAALSLVSFVLFSAVLPAQPASAALVSTGVGVVRGQQVLTSREVQILQLLDTALYAQSKNLQLLTLDSKAFSQAVQNSLLECVVSLEAENFNVVKITAEEKEAAGKKALKVLKPTRVWKDLQVSEAEFARSLNRKLQAKKFIQFRSQSSVLPVTDADAQKYFAENRLKFGNLPFENFKENIKSYLSRAQVEQRLKDWYSLLLNKYQAKNLLAEI